MTNEGDEMVNIEDEKIDVGDAVASFVAWVFMTGVALITFGFISDAKIIEGADWNVVTIGFMLIVWLLGAMWVIGVAVLWLLLLTRWIVPLFQGLWKLAIRVGDAISTLDANISSVADRKKAASNLSVQIAGDNAVQVQTAGRSHLDMPVFPAGVEDRIELLDILRRRRDRFAKQIAFWERMDDRKYRDIQIIGLTETGLTYGAHIPIKCIDVELLLEVLKTAQAEYEYQIVVLEAEIRDF